MKTLAVIVTVCSLLQGAATDTPPPGWRDAKSKALDLTLAGKEREVVALYETFVKKYPTFAEAHFMLGAAHESVARATFGSRAADAVKTRAAYFESAIVHMRRGLELAGPRAPFDWMRGFIDIHGLIGVNRPEEYERLVREAVKNYPADPYAHAYMLTMLADRGQPIAAAAKAARAAIPKTADARISVAGFVVSHVNDFARLMPASASNALLAEAAAFTDEALKLEPGDAYALKTKARIEELRKAAGKAQ